MIKLFLENVKRLYEEWKYRRRNKEVYAEDVLDYLDRISTDVDDTTGNNYLFFYSRRMNAKSK